MKRLLLVGGGHAHVEVLRRFAAEPEAGVALTLISPHRHMPYSGMLPGLIAGHYAWEDIHVDLLALAERAGADFAQTWAEALDPSTRTVRCTDGRTAGYDVCSVDIGSIPRSDLPGARDHALAVKPVERFIDGWRQVVDPLDRVPTATLRSVAVVGGGAGGVEILLAMQYAARSADATATTFPAFHLFSDAPHVLPGHPARVRRIFERVLAERGVKVHVAATVAEVTRDAVRCADGDVVSADLVVWATGASGMPWIRASGIAVDDRGFIRVDRHLRSISHPEIFGGGDVVSIERMPLPKAGVFAVREAPTLTRNLRHALRGAPLDTFATRPTALNLISTGDRYAVMAWGALALEGGWVWWWKDWIDRRFIARYR